MESYPEPEVAPAQHACAEDRSQHGYGRYSRGCRCDTCRAAKREYMRARRAAGVEPTRAGLVTANGRHRVRSIVVHGTTTAYRRGCRCLDCVIGQREVRRDQRAKKAS